MSGDDEGWSVIIPVKPAAVAKSRLSTIPATARVELARAFARDAIAAVVNSPLVGRIIIVGDTAEAPNEPGVQCLPDLTAGLNDAIELAAATLRPDQPVAVMVADLPAARPEHVTIALTQARDHNLALICDRSGTGTTMITSTRRENLMPRFGPRSRAAHVALGAVDLAHLDIPGLRCDVDTEVDLWDARRLGLGPHTQALLDTGPAV